ncbi:hypothetical protein KDA_18800 [Dictyobacter alpinus]|uniref:Uncharacterized protein n=1 Tax=Dictyobacter alpinus TaxID=2014873 RepID=A0A402B4Y1_9CHLR|nr:hypothetical protein KDA_18800 [Dictyobacter alpinus]
MHGFEKRKTMCVCAQHQSFSFPKEKIRRFAGFAGSYPPKEAKREGNPL